MPNPNIKQFDDEVLDVKKNSLYARLKRLFSTDVIVRNVGGKQIKVKDTDNIMYATDRNSLRDRFNRIRSTAYNAYTRDFSLSYQAARMDLFRDYDTMDMDPILSSALDIYADECLTYNELGKMLTVHSNNNNVKQILENLFDEILNIRFNLWSWVRNMTKYGDFYLKLYITPEYGIYMVEPISAYNVERIENSDPYNKRYVKFQIRPTDTAQAEVLENYEMAHFRLLSDSNFLPYGKAMIEGARRIWKQLSLMEDAMLISRIMRAPERRIFYTDIGNIPPAEVDAYMEKLISKMKKVPYMDENTGEYNLRFNLQNMVEDYYIPVRGGDSGTKIDTLPGMEWTGIEDLEYLRNKLMAALKIPKAFLGYEEGISGKATLASEDVRFARTIQRLQRIITSELTKIAIVHLYAQGYRDDSLVDFELELTNPSTIFEKEKIEIWRDKVDVASSMIDPNGNPAFFSYDWIYKNIFHLSDDDIKEIREQIVEDQKTKFRFSQIEEDGDDPAKPFKKMGGGGGGKSHDKKGGGGGGGGGGLGGLDLDLGDEEGGNEGGEEGEEKDGKGGPDLGGKEGKPEDLVKEIRLKRDQSGEHDARDQHPFGEDPLGHLDISGGSKKNSEGKKKSAIGHNFEKDSPFSLEEASKQPRFRVNYETWVDGWKDTIKSYFDMDAKSQQEAEKGAEQWAVVRASTEPDAAVKRHVKITSVVPAPPEEKKLRLKETKVKVKQSPEAMQRKADPSMINSLSEFLKKTQTDTKKELLKENQTIGSKSMLDEGNILE